MNENKISSKKIISKKSTHKSAAKKKQTAKDKNQKSKPKDYDLERALRDLGKDPRVSSGRMTEEELQGERERANLNRIKMDKAIILYTVFLWVCYFVYGDPFIWANALGISGWPMFLLMYLSYGCGLLATLGIIYLVLSGTKRAWDEMT